MIKLTVYKADNGEWGWRGQDGNNQIIATGGETYTRKYDALKALSNVVDEFRGAGPVSVPIQDEDYVINDNDVEMITIGGG